MAKGKFSSGNVGDSVKVRTDWQDEMFVLANSDPDGISSFITDAEGIILHPTIGGPENEIVVKTWAEVSAVRSNATPA